MGRINVLFKRLRALRRGEQIERDMDEELRFHIEMRTQSNIASGMSPEEARAAARRRFGNFGYIKDVCREISGAGSIETLVQDIRYGGRMLLKRPAFTVVAVLTLVLGIGANTTIFSIVNAVLLRPLAYEQPDELVRVYESNQQRGVLQIPVAPDNFLAWRERNQSFENIAAYAKQSFNLTADDEPERIDALSVSTNLFSLLRVAPLLGRAFSPEDEKLGQERVSILSYGLWQRRFGADPSVLGQSLVLDGNSYTIAGVMADGFQFGASELWVPLVLDPNQPNRVGGRVLDSVARLKPGVALAQARAEMDAIARQLEEESPAFNNGMSVFIIPLKEDMVGSIRPALLVLLGAVGFVLLIACANVANLLLARATARHKEIAIRMALGAGRLRLIRQLLTESTLLALIGGSLGILLAWWGTRLLIAFSPGSIPRAAEIGIDLSVLAFTLGISLLTGLIFGLVPALQSSSPNLNESLKEGGRSGASGSSHRARGLLVVSEVALSLVLLIGAGLMIKSFMQLQSVDPGFNPENVLTMQLSIPESKLQSGSQVVSLYQQLLERIEGLPGVESVGATQALPLSESGGVRPFLIEGRPAPDPGKEPLAQYRIVTPDYFRTMGIKILRGREFLPADTEQAPGAIIVNETFARRNWPGEDPVGRRVRHGADPAQNPWLTVVGVVDNVRHFGLGTEADPEMYWAHAQVSLLNRPTLERWKRSMTIVARTTSDPANLAGPVRREVLSLDKDLPIYNVRTLEDRLDKSLARPRFNTLLLAIFAAVALILASVGLYGVMYYSVTQRTHEIGLRMALGAQASDILRLVVGQGMALALAGVIIGVAAAFAVTRVMSSLLFGVEATDPATFAIISLLLIIVALVASYIPARRATKVDPMVVLRYE